ncbi:hypothetical protein CAPTEDRAFT_198930 [Capitella teleta]|uniref:P2X purinoreceptor 7 intracellular domain-containing protein n=1 Tax=Capitella teleta TaxID=283909 RepID=R7V0V7_CAPTE|nr:hypothetical protein CAPTEDRAFT_198930 [Capitella teleta]|eukprot:ELU09326.1 hypothetical protein CAPTEDRAFT_198930 [Capitella teleta]
MDDWNISNLDNRSYRCAAYRQFTWWVYAVLGARIRRVVPACAVNAIRKAFPEGVSRSTSFTTTQVDVKKAMKAWLRGAPDRHGGRQRPTTSKRLASEAARAAIFEFSSHLVC